MAQDIIILRLIVVCVLTLTAALAVFILACAWYWVAQAKVVGRGIYDEPRKPHGGDDDSGADYWKRGGQK